jgi:phage shock protein A
MGILDCVSTALRANTNALLDQAEDPEQTLDQIIRDMGDAIGQARGQVAEMIAQQKLLEADRDHNVRLAQEWEDKAASAVGRGADDLAREALRHKIDYEQNARAYTGQLQSQSGVVAKLKRDLAQLEAKYEATARDRGSLIARHRAALAQQTVARAAAQLTATDPLSQLARMDERIRMEEARAAAADEIAARPALEQQFTALEDDREMDRALADLHAKASGPLLSMGGTAGGIPRPVNSVGPATSMPDRSGQ